MSLAKEITILVNGYSLADAIKTFAPTADTEEVDRTCLADSARRYEQGFKNGDLAVTGVFDSDRTDLDKIHDVLSAAYNSGTTHIVTASYGPITPGDPAIMMDGMWKKYSAPQDNGALIFSNATFRSDNAIGFGVWLRSSQLNAGSFNGTSIDNVAASANGGLLHAHWENDNATGLQIILQHSVDNAAWVDLAEIIAGVRAAGRYTFAANPTAADTIEFNGVTYTFIAGVSSGTDVQIKANLALTLVELASVLNASVNSSILIATYSSNATQLLVSVDAPGTGGNAYTLDTPTAGNVTRSGATLAGGVNMVANEHGTESVLIPKGTMVRRFTRAKAIISGGDTVLVSAALARR